MGHVLGVGGDPHIGDGLHRCPPLCGRKWLWRFQSDTIHLFALTSRGPIVFMSRDLKMSPVTAIELYCLRVRVETLFAILKHLIGAFRSHFWSQRLPSHSRTPKKNQHFQQPTKENVRQVQSCWEGCERSAMLAATALGLLQLIALKCSPEVWG